MSIKHTQLTNKLQTALLKQYGIIVFVEKEQFYSERNKRVITMFVLTQRVWDEEKQRYTKKQLLKTADNVSILRYLVGMYQELQKATQDGEPSE